MKKAISIILTILLFALMLTGCSSVHDDNPVDNTVLPDESVETNTDYPPFEILDNGSFDAGDGRYKSYCLDEFIVLLKEKNIPITDMKGSENLYVSDSGTIDLHEALENGAFDIDFDKEAFSSYDVEAIKEVFSLYDFVSVYVETPWEIFSFKAPPIQVYSDADRYKARFLGIEEFEINTIRITHPEYVTEKGIKVGDSLEQVEAVYGTIFFDNRSYKQPEEDWSISCDAEHDMEYITFIGNDDAGVKYIEVGTRYFIAD